jgi:O-antigen/teichoic acid export membrane protein
VWAETRGQRNGRGPRHSYSVGVSDEAQPTTGMSDGAVIAVAVVVMNVATYGLTVAAARLMGPSGFGQFSAVMGILMVLNVLALGLQATGARRVAVAGDRARAREEFEIRRAAYRGALGLAAVTLLAAPALKVVLDLDSWLTLLALAVACGCLTVVGALAGLLQGEGRWWPLSAVFVAIGLARFAFGVLALTVSSSTASAMVGVAVGTVVPLAIGWFALSRRHTSPPRTGTAESHTRGVLTEVAQSTHALLAFFALSNIDIILARAVLPDQPAGLFAGGLIVSKAVTFLPQFVIVLAFPVMARRGESDRAHVVGLALVAGIGLAATIGVVALPWLAEVFIGGRSYADVTGDLWLFALVGTVLACIQFLVYSSLALEHPGAAYVLWAGAALFTVVGLTAHDTTALVVDRLWTALLTAVVLVALLTRGRPPRLSAPLGASSGRPPR